MSKLFSPIEIRGETVPNRVFVSPMCQYSSDTEDGRCGSWHTVHYGTRAVGGAGLVMVEATAVQPEGRITAWDLGLWSEDQAESLKPIVEVIDSQGATPAIQLAHAGRKASHERPWNGGGYLEPGQGGWDVAECVQLCRWFKDEGVDMIDCSSGGNSPQQDLKPYPGYQVQFASQIRKEADILTGAVGLITTPQQAEKILEDGEADVVLLARELLRNPYWPIHAKAEMEEGASGWPDPYARAAEIRQYPSR